MSIYLDVKISVAGPLGKYPVLIKLISSLSNYLPSWPDHSNCQVVTSMYYHYLLLLSLLLCHFFHVLQLVWVAQINQLPTLSIDFCTN